VLLLIFPVLHLSKAQLYHAVRSMPCIAVLRYFAPSFTYLLLLLFFYVKRIGAVAVPGGAGGFLLGGIIIKRMALTCRQALRGMFLLAIVGLGTMFMFAIHCDTAPLADATSHQRHSHTRRYAAPTARLCIIHEHGSEFLDPSHCCFMVHGFRSDTTISRPNS